MEKRKKKLTIPSNCTLLTLKNKISELFSIQNYDFIVKVPGLKNLELVSSYDEMNPVSALEPNRDLVVFIKSKEY